MSIVETFLDLWNHPEKYPDVITVNDFFDLINIPQKDRSDFAFAAIVKQATEARDENQV